MAQIFADKCNGGLPGVLLEAGTKAEQIPDMNGKTPNALAATSWEAAPPSGPQ